MASIILPSRWTSQPQYPVETNKQGFVWLPHTGDIGSTHLIQTAGTQITSASPGGRSAYNAGSTTNRIEYNTPYADGDMTIVVVCSFISVGAGRSITGVFKSAGTAVANYLSLETPGRISAVSTDNGNWAVALGRVAEVGKLYSIVGTFKSGGKRNVFVNGVKDAENTTARTPAAMDRLLIGSYLGSGAYSSAMTGHINLSVVLPVYLSEEEARDISANPWQIFRPQRRILYFDVASGGGATYTHTASLNAAIRAAQSATASLSAAIQQPNTATASLSAAIRQALASTASIDAAVLQARTATASLDALIQAAGSNTATASLDAAVQQQRSATASMDAAVLQAFAASAALDAAIRQSGSAGASLDAAVRQARTLQAALDAFIEAPGTLSASLDAAIQAPHTASASLSAAIAAAQTAVASLDAAIATRYTATASLDGYIHEASTLTASLDAAILAARSVSASLNAYIVEAGVVVLGAARSGARDLSTSRRVNLSTSRRR